MGVVDQSLPADGRSRLFEIGAHDDEKLVPNGLGDWPEAIGVFIGRVRIVNRAGADDHNQTFHITAVQDIADRLPRLKYQLRHLVGDRKLCLDVAR